MSLGFLTLPSETKRSWVKYYPDMNTTWIVGGETIRNEEIMSKIINGEKYILVDVVVIGNLIYDIYENEHGHKVKVCSGVLE